MRHTSEPTELLRRSVGKVESPVTPKPVRASDSEEWAWMVDEDPVFYLKKPGGAETGGA